MIYRTLPVFGNRFLIELCSDLYRSEEEGSCVPSRCFAFSLDLESILQHHSYQSWILYPPVAYKALPLRTVYGTWSPAGVLVPDDSGFFGFVASCSL